MSNRLQQALLDMADPARKLADALDGYLKSHAIILDYGDEVPTVLPYKARTVIDPAHAHLITATNRSADEKYIKLRAATDKDAMEDLQQRADELLHAIDLARTTITGAIPLQTLDLVRGKVKDVLANLTGTIEKDM